MSAEYLAAIASLATAGIIGATAIAALVQLRHMRSANAINAVLALRSMLDDERHTRARNVVLSGAVEVALAQPGCRRYLRAIHGGRAVHDEDRHFEEVISDGVMVANMFETAGNLVEHGTVSKVQFLEIYSHTVNLSWRRLEPLLAYIRECSGNETIGEYFEFLTVEAQDFMRLGRDKYPGTRRIQMHNQYPLSDDAASGTDG